MVGVGELLSPWSLVATAGAGAVLALIMTVDFVGWWDGAGEQATNVVLGGGLAGAVVASITRALTTATPELEEPRTGFLGEAQDAYFSISHSGRVWTAVIGALVGIALVAATRFALGGAETHEHEDETNEAPAGGSAGEPDAEQVPAADVWTEPDPVTDGADGFRPIEDE